MWFSIRDHGIIFNLMRANLERENMIGATMLKILRYLAV
ncbi:hypothetical protein H312_03108 [Anncaliia algerae PRA339]|uniref:Uncharacterized protein n=1 Tax=Anncaliia algerae PRA339 TaxID=1288291 RepID=A0A059EWW0_9MICR|nr:hypothetical protein H312_03108 [Anncaliia algerae PRA339]